MKCLAIVFLGALLGGAVIDAAKAADVYEVVIVPPATAQINLGIFRINVTTGQVVTAWGYVPNFTAIAEATKIPEGDYHLRVTETLDRTGAWFLNRYDAKSGRLWYASGGGNTPFAWSEIAEPAQTTAPK